MSEAEYADLWRCHRFPWCWWCGRGASDAAFWPWVIERAHIVASPRRCDSRAVVALCSWCHKASHGLDIVVPGQSQLPGATVANMVWLKKYFDGERFDRSFLSKNCIGRLPRAVRPPAIVVQSYASRRGSYPWTRDAANRSSCSGFTNTQRFMGG